MNFPPALSSSESGWLKAHAKDFHNLFGAAHGGDPNFVYETYQAAADAWMTWSGTA